MCVISCKVDDELKKQAESIFSSLGISMSAAINMFLRASVRENGLPIDTKLKKSDILTQRIKESDDENNLSPVFTTLEEAKGWLDA